MAIRAFENARDFALNNPHFVDNSQSITNIHNMAIATVSGLGILLKASIPEAAHDSSARHPPPLCHPGTREVYISRILSWAGAGNDTDSNDDGTNPAEAISTPTERVLWLHGLAGVGKSAIAQSCAEALSSAVNAVRRLGAAFFFSGHNSRDDANKLFTTIAYQLASQIEELGIILEEKIRRDPTLVNKVPSQQFSEFIVHPLKELKGRGREVAELVIIIDGLDECSESTAQQTIIEIVAASVREQSTPFRWIILSRPEPHIVSTFKSPLVQPLYFDLDLPVSRDVDNDIFRYLSDELSTVRREHGLPASWPSDKEIGVLVELSAGLFIYAATVVRFVRQENSSGPEDQLRLVLNLSSLARSRSDADEHPLSELDEFYRLIMRRIPPKVLPTTLQILLIASLPTGVRSPDKSAFILGLSESQFRNACRPLYSVMEIGNGDSITFYHASFSEFLKDERRSKEFWLMRGGDGCAGIVRRHMLTMLNDVHRNNTHHTIDPESDDVPINLPVSWPTVSAKQFYISLVEGFFTLCQTVPLDKPMLQALVDFDYSMVPVMWKGSHRPIFLSNEFCWDSFSSNIPPEYRSDIMRRYRFGLVFFRRGIFPLPDAADWERPYILGHGKRKALWWKQGAGSVLGPYWRFRLSMTFKLFKGVKAKKEQGEARSVSEASTN